MKKIISTVAAVAVMGLVASAMATTTAPSTTTTTATAIAKPAAPAAATTATTTTVTTPATKTAVTTTATGTSVMGQITWMDPTTVKVKDLKNGQEWSLNVGTANVKTYKVGDKVVATYDGTTKTLKTIEMAK